MKALSYIIFCIACIFTSNIYADSSHINKQLQNSIIPFHSVNKIIPGLSNYLDVEKLYGPPEEIDISKKETVSGITTGGNRAIHYYKRGLSFLLTKDAIVEGVYVELPYNGKTPNGLYLGMKKTDAVEIIRKNYYISYDLGESLLIAKTKAHTDNFQVWFTAGILTRMKLFAY